MNRELQMKRREQELKVKRALAEKQLKDEILRKATISRRLLSDKRHKEYKEFWEDIIKGLQIKYQELGESVTSNEEFIRQGLILTTKIQTILWILNTPEKFIEIETKIKESEELKNAKL